LSLIHSLKCLVLTRIFAVFLQNTIVTASLNKWVLTVCSKDSMYLKSRTWAGNKVFQTVTEECLKQGVAIGVVVQSLQLSTLRFSGSSLKLTWTCPTQFSLHCLHSGSYKSESNLREVHWLHIRERIRYKIANPLDSHCT